jgi:hypothetical protein
MSLAQVVNGLRAQIASRWRHSSRPDRLAHGVLLGGGALVFALFLWGRLGLSAWIFPPAPTAQAQKAVAGSYRVTLLAPAHCCVAGNQETATLLVQDAAGQVVPDAAVRVQPEMMTMPMQTPRAQVVAQGSGRYTVRPYFGIAGSWRLAVTVLRPRSGRCAGVVRCRRPLVTRLGTHRTSGASRQGYWSGPVRRVASRQWG